ncbi:MAG TPA: amidase [Baekduia sp.]|jgi:Asp-tRNA(Asn)/Glu-tRNA(Gln) amidotransferase A subunit family amidase
MSTDLHYLPATEALARFRDRSLSPVELLDVVIARAEAVDPVVNALVHHRYDEAREQAVEAEARYGGHGPAPRALEGIPLAIKEEEAVAGQPWTQGSLLYKDLLADHSSAFAQRMLDAGAIVHARTTAPEFSCAGFTQSRLHGITRNPWNPDYAVGGSSGGAGAALAAGTTTLASGSDIGGSIRLPASFNGVVGFKPPYGRVPVEAPFNLDTYCHCGPLARTVADTALFENVVAGPDPSDHTSLRPKLVLPEQFAPIAGMRIALSVDLGGWPVDPEVRANTLAAAAALREAGAIVDEVDLTVPREQVLRAAAIHFDLAFGAWIGGETAAHPLQTTGYAREFAARMAQRAKGGTFLEGLELEAAINRPVAAVLEEYDALLVPTVGTRGLLADDDYVDHGLTVDGTELEFYFEACFTPVFNILSRCPVLNVPTGFADNGVPTGLQIVGRTYDDLTTFRVGAALEAVRPWFDTAARRPPLAPMEAAR